MFLAFEKLATPSKFRFSLVFLLVQFWSKTFQIEAHEYSFCAHNVLYTFTDDACPGGVLFRKPIKIDEPCHCFGGDLKIYSSCRNEETGYYESPSTPSGCSQLYGWNGEARILIPGNFSGVNKETSKESCFGMPTNCKANVNTVVKWKPLKIVDMLKNHKDQQHYKNSASLQNKTFLNGEKNLISLTPKLFSAEISSEKHIEIGPVFNMDDLRLPSDGESPNQVTERNLVEDNNNRLTREAEYNGTETTEGMTSSESEEEFPQSSLNEEIAMLTSSPDLLDLLRYIEGVKVGRISDPAPNTKTFQLIKESVKIAQKLIPNHVIKDEHLYEAYLAFSHTFRHLDEDEKTDHHWNDNIEDFNSVLLSLQTCYDGIPTLSFKTSGQPQKIQSVYIPQESGGFEKTLKIPEDRAHKLDQEDVIIGIMWKIIDIVHATCHQDFKTDSPSTQFNYLISIEDLFLQPAVQKRWYSSQLILTKETETNSQIITHPDLKLLMENLDVVDAAAHFIFGFQFFLKKPHKIFPSNPNSNNNQNNLQFSRYKRKTSDYSAFEIYGGEAYCLQKTDETLLATIQNSYPSIQKICME